MTKVIAAGMPASGKSTFIAALTHLLTAEQVPTELRLAKLSEDEGHLSRLEEAWLAAARLDRTRKPSEKWVSFYVEDTQTKAQSELLVPDLRGELFAQPATVGRCQRRLWEALVECDGLLLFTNAEAPMDDLMVDQVSHMAVGLADLGAPVGSVAVNAERDTSTEINPITNPDAGKFRADDMPEQAKLVELLQAMNRLPIAAKRRRLALVVSAWDVVGDYDPLAWVSANRPMLHQYLKHASDWWEVRAYGVSAQGGDLPREHGKLRAVRFPGERVIVVGHDAGPHDLTSIVKWVASSTVQRDV
jgi:hypothetical protein